MSERKSLKELVIADAAEVAKLSSEDMEVRNAVLELANWCQDRLPLLEKGRHYGFRMGISVEAAEAIEAALPPPNGMRVIANMLRVQS